MMHDYFLMTHLYIVY